MLWILLASQKECLFTIFYFKRLKRKKKLPISGCFLREKSFSLRMKYFLYFCFSLMVRFQSHNIVQPQAESKYNLCRYQTVYVTCPIFSFQLPGSFKLKLRMYLTILCVSLISPLGWRWLKKKEKKQECIPVGCVPPTL